MAAGPLRSSRSRCLRPLRRARAGGQCRGLTTLTSVGPHDGGGPGVLCGPGKEGPECRQPVLGQRQAYLPPSTPGLSLLGAFLSPHCIKHLLCAGHWSCWGSEPGAEFKFRLCSWASPSPCAPGACRLSEPLGLPAGMSVKHPGQSAALGASLCLCPRSPQSSDVDRKGNRALPHAVAGVVPSGTE